jgi:VIT1/CCC1 family predicted Fe2+/Mn2+ transporter
MMKNKNSTHAQQQKTDALRYAHLLDWGARVGLLALVLSFAAYVFGVLTPHVPLEQLPSVWGLPVSTYLHRTATPTGWGWLALAHKGDLSNLIGISLLAGCSLPPLLGLVSLYLQRRDYLYAGICIVVIAVLVLAASGILTGGH